MSKKVFNENQYHKDLKRYKKAFYSSALLANRSINVIMMTTFYEIGEDIQKKGMWIESYIKRISQEFKKQPTMMSEQNIRNMCRLTLLITFEEIFTLRLFEHGWDDIVSIINSSDDHDYFVTNIQYEKEKGGA